MKSGQRPLIYSILPPTLTKYMLYLGSWNIHSLNCLHKQKFIHDWTLKHHLDIIGLVETKIAPHNMASVESGLTLPS